MLTAAFPVTVVLVTDATAAPSDESMSAEKQPNPPKPRDDEVVKEKNSPSWRTLWIHGLGTYVAESFPHHSSASHVPSGHNLLDGYHPNLSSVSCATYHDHHGHSHGHHGY